MKYQIKSRFTLAAVTVLSLGLGLASCSDDAQEAVQNVAEAPELQGSFTDKCSTSVLLDASERVRLNFEGNSFTRSQIFYEEENCVNEMGRIEYKGEFTAEKTGENSATEGGTLDLEITEATVTTESEDLADALNSINYCGHDDFTAGKEVTIAGQQTEGLCPLENIPVTLYTLYRIDDHNLYLSDTDFATMSLTPGDRSQEVKYQEYYTNDEVAKAEAEKTAETAKEDAQGEVSQAADKVEEETEEAANQVEQEAEETVNETEQEAKETANQVEQETEEAANEVEQEVEETTKQVEQEIEDGPVN